MKTRDLVVVGASAGGVEALRTLVATLPADLAACVVVVLHLPASAPSALPSILARVSSMPVRSARNEDPLTPGTILVAPPNHHVVVYDDAVTLSHGPRENGHRPAVDVLFRSAARTRDGRVIGIVLSGGLDDGAAGMLAIRQRGGACLVQDFDEALHAGMPRAAFKAVPDARVVPVADIGRVLQELVAELVADDEEASVSESMEVETRMAVLDAEAMHADDPPGRPSGFACPDCHGVLFELTEDHMIRFRCRVGHAWSPESLTAQQTADMESALWMALRNLEEKAALHRRLGARALDHGHQLASTAFGVEADEALRAAELLRSLIDRIGADQADQEAGGSAGSATGS